MEIIIISVRTKMPIMDAVNQQVLSFNVYLIAILHTDTKMPAHIHVRAKRYTFIFQTKNIAAILYAEDIEFCIAQTHKQTHA